MTPTRLVFIPTTADQPAPMFHVDADGTVVDAGRLTLENAADFRPMRTVAIVPGADVMLRRLDLPSGGDAQVRAAALWALRDDLASPGERLSVALGPVEAKGRGRLAAVTASPLLQAWSDYLSSLGVRPEAVVPDYLVLPEPEDDDETVVWPLGADVAVRTRRGAATVQPDLVSDLVVGRRQDLDATGWRAGLARVAAAPPLNLVAADVKRRTQSRRDVRVACGLAVLLAASPILLDAVAGARDRLAVSASERRVTDLVRTAAPDLAQEPDAAERLIAEDETHMPHGATGAAAALFKAVEAVDGAEIDALSAEAGRGLSATVSYAAFQDLERLRSAMSEAGYRLDDESTVEDAGRIISGVRVRGA